MTVVYSNFNAQGSRVKLVVNMIMGTMMSGFAEGLALGKAADIPLDSLLQVIIEIVPRVVGSVGKYCALSYLGFGSWRHEQSYVSRQGPGHDLWELCN